MANPKYTHKEMIDIMLSDPDTKKAYDNLEPEFALISARLDAGKTQEDGLELACIKVHGQIKNGESWSETADEHVQRVEELLANT